MATDGLMSARQLCYGLHVSIYRWYHESRAADGVVNPIVANDLAEDVKHDMLCLSRYSCRLLSRLDDCADTGKVISSSV